MSEGGHAEQLFTAAEAALLLGVGPATITKWAQRGRLVSVGRKGRAHVYRWADLLDAEFNTRATGCLPNPRQLSEDMN